MRDLETRTDGDGDWHIVEYLAQMDGQPFSGMCCKGEWRPPIVVGERHPEPKGLCAMRVDIAMPLEDLVTFTVLWGPYWHVGHPERLPERIPSKGSCGDSREMEITAMGDSQRRFVHDPKPVPKPPPCPPNEHCLTGKPLSPSEAARVRDYWKTKCCLPPLRESKAVRAAACIAAYLAWSAGCWLLAVMA